jgi:diguanylate cyclase (GGDEF)-like protein/PAS domain S-box-containing protein
MTPVPSHPATLPSPPSASGHAPDALAAEAAQADLLRTLREQQVILDNAGVGIVFVRDRQLLRCNRRYAEMHGYDDPAQVHGLDSRVMYPSEQAHAALGADAYPRLLQGHTFRTRQHMRRRDGSLFWCQISGRLIDPAQPESGSIWIEDDIDAMVLTEERLRSSLHEQSLVLDHAMVGIVFLQNRHVTRCNRTFAQMLGYAPEEMVGMPSRRWYLHEADWANALTTMYAPLSRGEAYRGQLEIVRRDGSALWCEVQAKAVDPSDLSLGTIWICMDISARRLAEAEVARLHAELEQRVADRTEELRLTVASLHREVLERQAAEQRALHVSLHDSLTGLPNRAFMDELLARALRQARRDGTSVAVVFMDLDRFKSINDVLGHDSGDELLRVVAERLRSVLRDTDTVARIGGDEFVLLLPQMEADATLERTLQRMQDALRPPLMLKGRPTRVSCSMGVSVFPRDSDDLHTLLRQADMAMYMAKERGRAGHQHFDRSIDVALRERSALEEALQAAVDSQAFELHYQPQVNLCAEPTVVFGVEALLRWSRPGVGPVSPAVFVPVAEDMGLIERIGHWVLQQGCEQAARWRSEHGLRLRMGVNVSARQLMRGDFAQEVRQALADTGLAPADLDLEITESLLMTDVQRALDALHTLHAMGVHISIDDFGTGHSSLAYLSRFPLGTLKIDRSFVQAIQHQPRDATLCRTIVAMGHSLGLQVLAEGVETAEQRELLRLWGCDQFQGYVFSRPVPAAQVPTLARASMAGVGS